MKIATMEIPVKASGKTEFVQVSWWSDKEHPVWNMMKPVAYALALGIILKMTATHFDSGEVKTIVGTFVAGVIFEGFGVKKK